MTASPPPAALPPSSPGLPLQARWWLKACRSSPGLPSWSTSRQVAGCWQGAAWARAPAQLPYASGQAPAVAGRYEAGAVRSAGAAAPSHVTGAVCRCACSGPGRPPPSPPVLDPAVQGGTELSFIVAVDFTGSNGDPRNPQSLHYFSQQPTMYEGEPLRDLLPRSRRAGPEHSTGRAARRHSSPLCPCARVPCCLHSSDRPPAGAWLRVAAQRANRIIAAAVRELRLLFACTTCRTHCPPAPLPPLWWQRPSPRWAAFWSTTTPTSPSPPLALARRCPPAAPPPTASLSTSTRPAPRWRACRASCRPTGGWWTTRECGGSSPSVWRGQSR